MVYISIAHIEIYYFIISYLCCSFILQFMIIFFKLYMQAGYIIYGFHFMVSKRAFYSLCYKKEALFGFNRVVNLCFADHLSQSLHFVEVQVEVRGVWGVFHSRSFSSTPILYPCYCQISEYRDYLISTHTKSSFQTHSLNLTCTHLHIEYYHDNNKPRTLPSPTYQKTKLYPFGCLSVQSSTI